jgi:SAM-dependent methyltransferase
VTAHLTGLGVDAWGVDLSPRMVAHARRLHPDAPFEVGDLTALDVPDGAWAGAVAPYSIIHVPRPRLGDAAREIRRVLRAGAPFLAAFHVGSEVRHLDSWFEQAVDLDFTFYETAEMADALTAAGFAVEAVEERAPYPDVEVATRRGYVTARAR